MKAEIREEFWHALEKSPYVMISLRGTGAVHAEPMTVMLDRDARHTVWFFTSKQNRIAGGGRAMAQFASKGHDVFACLSGSLSTETNPAIRDKHWSKMVESWFPGGKNDPNLLMLRFEIDDAEVWTADLGIVGTFKMLTGQTVKTSEMGEHERGLV